IIGVAGPVRNGRARVTNLPWILDERALERKLELPRVLLVNDLVVAARGCLEVHESELVALTDELPRPNGNNLATRAAGPGLGEARLVWNGKRHLVLPTEGGHCDFAPRSPLEVEIWQYFASRFKEHVSYERVVSGAGLGALYDFFASRA